KKGLDCLNLAVQIPDGEIQIIKFRMDSLFYDFVIAPILMLRSERVLPALALPQLFARNCVYTSTLIRKLHFRAIHAPIQTSVGHENGALMHRISVLTAKTGRMGLGSRSLSFLAGLASC